MSLQLVKYYVVSLSFKRIVFYYYIRDSFRDFNVATTHDEKMGTPTATEETMNIWLSVEKAIDMIKVLCSLVLIRSEKLA